MRRLCAAAVPECDASRNSVRTLCGCSVNGSFELADLRRRRSFAGMSSAAAMMIAALDRREGGGAAGQRGVVFPVSTSMFGATTAWQSPDYAPLPVAAAAGINH